MKRLAAALCLILTFCEKPVEAPAPAPPPVAGVDKPENANLLNLVFGAAVIDRSYELSYENSAAQAIDGTPYTNWSSAPGGRMVITLALAAPTRLTRLGATVPTNKSEAPERIRFEASVDGTTWRQVLETPLRFDLPAPQLFDIEPVDARYLRVTAIEPHDYYSVIASLWAVGSETAPFVQPPIEGCWMIDNVPARFERHGARVFGTIGDRMIVDGGSDGRVYRFMWLEGPMWGYATVSITPDGRHLSGVRFHEEVKPFYNGDGWLGTRVPCGSATLDGAKMVDAIIRRTAKWRLYGVRFDPQDRLLAEESKHALDLVDQLVRDHPKHRFVLAAREYRAPSVAKNHERCQKKLDGVREALKARGTDLARIEFANAGPERGFLPADTTTQRAMDSAVELQVLPLQ